ncbi:MAG: universal stress protein, partial [Chloroflexota bacterium]
MNKILLAYDGTAQAEAALGVAAELATKLGAEIGVVSVVPMHPGRIGGDPWDDASVHEQELLQASERLAAIKPRAQLHRATGDPATEIERTAAEHGYDLIVVGSRGLSTIGRLLQGSISEHVATHAKANVMVVPPPPPAGGGGGG